MPTRGFSRFYPTGPSVGHLIGYVGTASREEYEQREYYEPISVATRDLSDHLHDQLTLLRLSDRELLLGEEIIGNISDEGYIVCPLETVVHSLNEFLDEQGSEWAGTDDELRSYSMQEAQDMLRTIQAFDPPGIGARDLRECILLQLRDYGVQELTASSGGVEPTEEELARQEAERRGYVGRRDVTTVA